MTGPLSGVRVLDFGRVFAAPFATRNLLEMGAEVIKVEPPVEGDFLRGTDMDGSSFWFGYWNYGKRSISVDLRQPAGVDLVRQLAMKCDVLVESFLPGTLARLGLGAEDLQRDHPGLIYCSVSGFGQTGPYADRPLYASTADALAGIMTMVGRDGDPPFHPGAAMADPNLGLHAAIAICAALFDRTRTGIGRKIDIAMFDTLVWIMGPMAERNAIGEDIDTVSRQGIYHRTIVPTGTFECRGRWLEISGGQPERIWQSLAQTMGRPDLADLTRNGRVENRDEIYRALAEWVAAQPSAAEVEGLLRDRGIPCYQINTLSEMLQIPQLWDRGTLEQVAHPILGPLTVTNAPYHFDGGTPHWAGKAPGLGEHNRDVFGEILGLGEPDLARLEGAGVLYRR